MKKLSKFSVLGKKIHINRKICPTLLLVGCNEILGQESQASSELAYRRMATDGYISFLNDILCLFDSKIALFISQSRL